MTVGYDIIPDIHGQHEKLLGLLQKLGWHEINGKWQHYEKERKIIFLGDLIDRGRQNRKVLQLIRKLQKLKLAYVLMGNHELNAIYFHSKNPKTNEPLRRHSLANIKQHQTFLDEFPPQETETEDIINWFCSLPLFLEFKYFRVIHACWETSSVNRLKQINENAIFSRDFYIKNNFEKNGAYQAVELLTKGPEARLPLNSFFRDKTGIKRYSSRLAWWRHESKSWRDLCVSVPNASSIPDSTFTDWNIIELYPRDAIPVFFGHYWMNFPLKIESHNALCLDCSAGTSGPLIAYHFDPHRPSLDLRNITSTLF